MLLLVCGHWLCPIALLIGGLGPGDPVPFFGPVLHLPCPFPSPPILAPPLSSLSLGAGDRGVSRCLKMPAFFSGFMGIHEPWSGCCGWLVGTVQGHPLSCGCCGPGEGLRVETQAALLEEEAWGVSLLLTWG